MKDRNILLLNNFFSFPLWQHLSWDFQTLMRQSLIYFDTFKTHPALASPIIFSFLPCSVGLVLLFMRPSITSSFSFFNACQVLYLWHVCGEGESGLHLVSRRSLQQPLGSWCITDSITHIFAASLWTGTPGVDLRRLLEVAHSLSASTGPPQPTSTAQCHGDPCLPNPPCAGGTPGSPTLRCHLRARAQALTVSLAAATGMGSSPLARGGSSGSWAANSEGSALGSPYSW